jgi:lipid-A-disaccharide synthase
MLIGIVAGETSGDILGAGLIKALRLRYPQARFAGVGGPRMLACGFESITPMERLSVMGFIEPLGRLPELLRLKRDLVTLFQNEKPAVFIGIDSPGFNLRLEQPLHDLGIPVVHYVSPSVWAWGQKRIFKIKTAVDLMLTLFPFEADIYQQHGIPVHCVGHPMADRIDPDADQLMVRIEARQALCLTGVDVVTPLVCLMPGSRRDEVARLAPVFLQSAALCLQQRPQLKFVIPCANELRLQQMRTLLDEFLSQQPDAAALRSAIYILDGQSHDAMRAADVVLQASGTATLEAMLLKRPMVVAYRLSSLTWMLASRLVKVPYVSLPNLLAGEELVPEFLQDAVTPQALSAALMRWLDDEASCEVLMQRFTQIHRSIRLDADTEAAAAIARLIEA